jgi:hypothetical protein
MFIYIHILSMNMRDYPTQTQAQVREPLVLVRKDMDVNEHERLSNTDTTPSKGTTGISKGCVCVG